MNSLELQGNIDSDTLSTIAKRYNSVYNSNTYVDAVRNLILKTFTELDKNQHVDNDIKIYRNWEHLQEYYKINFDNGGNLRLKMASYRPVSGWNMTVKYPHTFTHFNKFILNLQSKIESINPYLLPIVPCFRELLSTVGDGFTYEVDFEDSFFNLLLTKSSNFHAIELEVNLS